jgi:hypothetical protein
MMVMGIFFNMIFHLFYRLGFNLRLLLIFICLKRLLWYLFIRGLLSFFNFLFFWYLLFYWLWLFSAWLFNNLLFLISWLWFDQIYYLNNLLFLFGSSYTLWKIFFDSSVKFAMKFLWYLIISLMNDGLQIIKFTLIKRFQKYIIIAQQLGAKIKIIYLDFSIE